MKSTPCVYLCWCYFLTFDIHLSFSFSLVTKNYHSPLVPVAFSLTIVWPHHMSVLLPYHSTVCSKFCPRVSGMTTGLRYPDLSLWLMSVFVAESYTPAQTNLTTAREFRMPFGPSLVMRVIGIFLFSHVLSCF